MAEIQAKALYDFEGDTGAGELSFRTDETLTITQQDIGDGWWEARNYLGNVGLIPQAYVELIEPPEPSFPPPPPPVPSAPVADTGYNNGWGQAGGVEQQQSFDGWDDDDWDDDDGESSTSTGGAPSINNHQGEDLQGSGPFGLSQAKSKRDGTSSSPPGDMSKYGTVKKTFNRFSAFAKAGGEAFMMGNYNGDVSEADIIRIVETEEGLEWDCHEQPYTCTVRSPKKESKLKGLKSFIAYQITPSFSNIQVSRRYKHFDWLHVQLENKFTCIPIPPLPDKTISAAIGALSVTSQAKAGRYEDEFIDHRMKLLQMWVDRICHHPVLSRSEVFLHFLTCTDEKKWKQGKRKAEKDEFTGGKFFHTLRAPSGSQYVADVDTRMENFCKFQKSMEDNVKHLLGVAYDNRKKHLGPFKREYQKIGEAFKLIAQTFNLDSRPSTQSLTGAIDYTGDTYNQIGEMFEKQPRNDTEPLLDVLNEYKGILGQFPDVLKVHEGAVGKAKECSKMQQEGRMVESTVQSISQKADIISCGTLAEIGHFQTARTVDFKNVMITFLKGQIEFYGEITNKLQTALQQVENSTSGDSLYVLLGLQKGANHDEIKKAYRKLALRFHPDKNQGDAESTEKFKEINHAHKVLSDNTKRGIYDRYGSLGLYAADTFGEENVNTYLVLTSGWCKALAIFCGVITGCYCCCCCFCCCCNFCCGKFKPEMPEDEGDYANLHDESSTPEDENGPVTNQPEGSAGAPLAMPMPAPASNNMTETSNLTSDIKTTYGLDGNQPITDTS